MMHLMGMSRRVLSVMLFKNSSKNLIKPQKTTRDFKRNKIEIMKLKEELKKTRFVSGMAVKKLAESCKGAIDGDITEAEKQIKHLKQKNKELKEELKEEKEWEKQTGREEAIEEYEKVAYEMCESRLHANDPILMAGSAKCLNEENKKLKEEKKEHFKSLRSSISIAKELYREMKYALGYGEFDEPNRQNMYDDIKQLKAEKNEKLQEHKKFDEIWKTECITEQDIIDMKRQISDQCDLINKLKAELNDFTSVFDGNVSMIKKNEELKQGIKDLFLKFD